MSQPPLLGVPSDKPRRLVYDLPTTPAPMGNEHSSVAINIGGTTFPCHPTVDGLTILSFAQLAGQSAEMQEIEELGDLATEEQKQEAAVRSAQSAAKMVELLQTAIIDYPAFEAFVKKHRLDFDFIGQLAGDLVEAYASRPTS